MPGTNRARHVASGDINNDGADDLIIGAARADPGGRTNTGESYVLFGPLSVGALELSTAADITLNGVDAGDGSGAGVASGDINNDSATDLIIGARNGDPGGRTDAGESYVLFGPLSAGTLELSTAPDITLNGIDAGDISGTRVGSGDINNDGVDDLIIGAAQADPGGRLSAGETYVVFGPLSAGTLELATAADITLNGIDAGDISGGHVASGDINNDGVPDLIIGALLAAPGGRTDAGESYVLFGPLSAGALELSTAADITLNGIDEAGASTGDQLGRVATGDINNDGVADLIIGAAGADPGGRLSAGESYVLFGPLSPGTLELSASADITINGIDAGDGSGAGVAIGDINNDGADDLIIGALAADPGGRLSAGESYVLFGPLTAGTLELSTAADITLNGIDAGDLSGTGAASGDVNNDGVTDLIIGGVLADPGGRLSAGESYVLFGPLFPGTVLVELSTAPNSITMAIGANPGGGALFGTTPVNAVGGVGTFSDLSIDKAGVGYTLAASSSGLTGATSAAFNITAGAASKLTFSVQPSNTDADALISPAVKIQVLDALDNAVTTATNSISMTIGTNPSAGALSGTTPVNAVNGVGTFSDLSIDEVGVGYTLVASASGLTGATSNAFNIATAPIAVPGITEWGLIGMAIAFVVLLLLRMHRQSTQRRSIGP